MKYAYIVLFVSPAVLFSSCDNPSQQASDKPSQQTNEFTIATDEGAVSGHTFNMGAFPQKIVPVSIDESRQFEAWASEAASFLTAYGTPQSGNELKQFDEAFKAWQDSTTKSHPDQYVINVLGAYLGQRMVQDFNMEWVVVVDKYGRDYAVRHKTSNASAFPFSSVMKRIEDKEHDFIYGVYHIIKNEIENGALKKSANSKQDNAANLR